ncbi:MAG: shikimate dehydrogenase [Alphaproteobacteria bacterium]
MTAFTSATRIAGVIGWPVGHSKSPLIHNYWARRYGIDAAYGAFPVAPGRMDEAVRGLAALGLAGANVTVPHKEAALRAADHPDALASRIGAANTLVVRPDGTVAATNTDAFGFLENLRQGAPDWDPSAGPVLVVGAGGAARAVIVALIDAGARILLTNRTDSRAAALAAEFGAEVTAVEWNRRAEAVAEALTVVNTTAAGMQGQPALDLPLAGLDPAALVTDLVYAPLETRLLAEARARGAATVDGLGMLLHQARPAFQAWFGVLPEVDDTLRAMVLAA